MGHTKPLNSYIDVNEKKAKQWEFRNLLKVS